MRHKTSGYFLLSALLVSLILGLCILLNLRCPQAVSDDALTQEQLTRGVTLTGWQQTGPGHWRFAFEAPADVPELVALPFHPVAGRRAGRAGAHRPAW